MVVLKDNIFQHNKFRVAPTEEAGSRKKLHKWRQQRKMYGKSYKYVE